MLNQAYILIAEDEPITAFSLAHAVEDAGGRVLGPCASVGEALALLEDGPAPTAAVLDIRLCDGEVTPLAEYLIVRAVPVLFHSASKLPERLTANIPYLRLIAKPASPNEVVKALDAIVTRCLPSEQ